MNYNEISTQIKSSVTLSEICEKYGIELDRNGFAVCPFHTEKTPSLKVYKNDKGFYCFGCGKGGDIIAFVQGYFGLDYKGAVSKLNYDFSLNLPIDRKMSLREKYELDRKAKERKAVLDKKRADEEAKMHRYQKAYAEWIEIDKIIRTHKPKNPDEPLDLEFVKALHRRELVEIELEEAESEVMKCERCV